MSRAARTIDLACLAFAAWTLLCNAAVLAGGSPRELAAAAGTAAALALILRARRGRAEAPAADGRALWGLCLLAALAVLLIHRPDRDDADYIGLAAGVADFPGRPLLRQDTFYGIPGLPILLPVYRVHSIEALYGTVSWLTGLEAIAVSHLLSAPLWGFLAPLAWARLFRAVDEERWLSGTLAATAFLLLNGGAHASYGNLAFARLFQGKCVFLAVLAPLTLAYGVEFMRAPSRRGWCLLAAALVASVGATSTALWTAPALALAALGSRWRPGREATRALAAGAATTLYPLALALALRGEAERAISAGTALAPGARWALLAMTAGYVLGTRRAALAAVALLAPVLCGGAGARLAGALIAAFLLLYNPAVGPWAALHVTGPWAYFRVFWLLPVPFAVGLAAMAAGGARGRGRRLAAALLAAWALWPGEPTWARANGAEVRWPSLKVPPEYGLVRLIDASVPAGAVVVAPREVSLWLVTQNRHADPLLVKDTPFDAIHRFLPAADIAERRRLMAEVSAVEPARIGPAELRLGLERTRAAGACFFAGLPWAGELRGTLEGAGFRPAGAAFGYEVWTRAGTRAPDRRRGAAP